MDPVSLFSVARLVPGRQRVYRRETEKHERQDDRRNEIVDGSGSDFPAPRAQRSYARASAWGMELPGGAVREIDGGQDLTQPLPDDKIT